MSWGLLFHREVYLTYRRIQDIHVNRNIVERWMGLAKVPIQTGGQNHDRRCQYPGRRLVCATATT